MIERIARIIALHSEEQSESDWSRFVVDARAVIAGMREPTKAMLAADQGQTDDEALASWQAMIDAALNEDG